MTHAPYFLKDKSAIENWLTAHSVSDYTLQEDPGYGWVVNVDTHVYLGRMGLSFIPVKFNHIQESFNICQNALTHLEFCPTTVGGYFEASYNQLTSLKGCPLEVGGHFGCRHNQITSLEFCPKKVGTSFHCEENPALGSVQEITDFKEIYGAHLKIVNIKQEKALLSQNVAVLTPPKKLVSDIITFKL